MAPDHTFNYTGLAHHNSEGLFVTHLIFAAFLLLFTIPIQVQVVTICDRLHLYRWFSVLLKKLYRILQVVWGLNWVSLRVPPIAETSMPIAENCTKTEPATGTNFTTARRTCICLNDQTHSYPQCRGISLAPIIVISRDTGPSAGQSSSRIRNCNSSRAFDIYHRTAFH